MNVLSLFDGMSGGQLALQKAGLKVDKYYSCEIDEYAQSVTRYNFPNTIFLGDVTKVDFSKLKDIDLVIGGSPCQDLSFAKGNGKGLEGSRSSLFYKFVEAIEVCKPEYFLLENVKMKQEWKDIISDLLGVQPQFINSADFSAQQRQRLYWSNIPVYAWTPCNDKLQDILENGEAVKNKSQTILTTIYKENVKSMLKRNKMGLMSFVDREKSHCLDANYFKGGNLKSYFEKHRRQLVFNRCIQVGEADIKGRDILKRVYSPEGKSPTLTTCGGGHREPKVSTDNKTWRKLSPLEAERLQTVPDNYTSKGLVYKDIKETDVADNFYYSPKMLAWIKRHGERKNKKLRIQSDNDKVQMIEASHFKGCSSQRFFGIEDTKGLRYITPLECERAQTVPDNYTSKGIRDGKEVKISNTQRYKMLGNGWTRDVIAHIFKSLRKGAV